MQNIYKPDYYFSKSEGVDKWGHWISYIGILIFLSLRVKKGKKERVQNPAMFCLRYQKAAHTLHSRDK